MKKRTIYTILGISQIVPFLFIILYLVSWKHLQAPLFISVGLLEAAFLLPSILYIIISLRYTSYDFRYFSTLPKYQILCPVYGLSFALLITLLIVFILGLTDLTEINLREGILIHSLVSPLIATYVSIKIFISHNTLKTSSYEKK
jgi:hypothetical protein